MIRLIAFLVALMVTSATAETPAQALENSSRSPIPRIFKDPGTGIIFYSESDGRHVAAISPDGTLLWHRAPFTDIHLEPYRTTHPVIVSLSRLSDAPTKGHQGFILVTFNSSQRVIMDFKKGDSSFMGQD